MLGRGKGRDTRTHVASETSMRPVPKRFRGREPRAMLNGLVSVNFHSSLKLCIVAQGTRADFETMLLRRYKTHDMYTLTM